MATPTARNAPLAVDNVQALASNTTLKTIPPRYIRPLLQTDHENNHQPHHDQIPVIDLNKLTHGQHFSPQEMAKFHQACQDWGFFQLVNHGVAEEVMEKTIRDVKGFFELPLEEKRYGCSKMEAVSNYSLEMEKIKTILLGLMAKNLGTDEEKFINMFRDGTQTMRMNYYPPCPEPSKVMGISPHSDATGLTILLQINEVNGLQIRHDGRWVPVQMLPKAILINIGDVLEILSNGRYKSIEHRVVVNMEKERMSVATFHEMNRNVTIRPLSELILEGEVEQYKSIHAGEFVKLLSSHRLDGKSLLDLMKIVVLFETTWANIGKLIHGRIKTFTSRCNPTEAEAMTIKEALSWVDGVGLTQVIFELDSLLTVNAINNLNSNMHKVDVILDECKRLLASKSMKLMDYKSDTAADVSLVNCISRVPGELLPNALLINIGDVLEMVSNGRYKSIEDSLSQFASKALNFKSRQIAMASIPSELSISKLNSRSDWRGKVRIVGKIRAWSDLETKACNGSSSPWVYVQRPKEGESSDFVTVSFGDQLISQKDSYKLDYCYEQGEEAAQVFSREVKPLLSGVLDGLSASVLAYGARGSGKTFLMQGTEEKPGLAPLALAEILSIGERTGGFVALSCYEVYQDHIYDLLEQNRQEVPVKTLPELYKLYGQGSASHNSAQKGKNDVSRRSHKGLIIYFSHENKDSGVSTTGKINFVDLAGYVDTKRKSIDGSNLVESAWINKSLYTLQNVVKALNGRERVPYRESKLTRMLQDSFEGKSQSLMVSCLGSQLRTTERRIKSQLSTAKGRKLFDGSSFAASILEKTLVKATPTIKPSSLIDTVENSLSSVTFDMEHSQTVKGIPEAVTVEETKPNLSPQATEHSLRINIKTACNTISLEEREGDSNLEKENIETACNTISLEEPKGADVNVSPPLSARLRELSNSLKSLCSTTPLACEKYLKEDESYAIQDFKNLVDPKTPTVESCMFLKNRDIASSPWEACNVMSSGVKQTLVQQYLNRLNSASKEELKELKGIGEKRATYILELREESPEPFKNLDDLKTIGLSEKHIKGMMKKYAGDLF
ncbi:hypothetical protein Sjap_020898 [Stephania japonica]|uniref:Uncharacterized protein n=1 Tax=Stephania japonica TaxID=461633 RepID=A0AAP0FAH7_9MAGN